MAIVKIPFRSRAMVFLIIAYFLFPWERGFSTGNSGTVEPSVQHHEQLISGEETHALTISIVSVMASDIVDGL